MTKPLDSLLANGRSLFGEGPEATPSNIHAAAVGLAASWYRNTDAVESDLHVRTGVSDVEMLRRNAWVTELSRRAIADVAAGADPLPRFETLFDELVATLPLGAVRQTLREEKGGAPVMAARWIATNGLGNWFGFLMVPLLYPSHWWGAPGFPRIVERYLELGAPDPETFRRRMLDTPWELSDAQAEFVCRHRYDVR